MSLTQRMKREPIINFEGMQFRSDGRARLPRSKQWQTRRQAKNRLGVARNVRSAFMHLLGM